MQRITSAHNSRIKLVNRLRSKRGRQREDLFVIDYPRDLQRALHQGYEIEFAFVCPTIADGHLAAFLPMPDVIHITAPLLKRISYRENPSGIIAVMRSLPTKNANDLANANVKSAFAFVDLRIPGNIGALIRTGDAAGIDALMLVDCPLDLYNPNIIRNSAGACFAENIYQMTSSAARDYFKENGFHLIAADGQGDTLLFDADFRFKSAIILGSEDRGLPPGWLDICDQRVRIPMFGNLTDSLNVSVSGAIFMAEVMRQRHQD